MREIELRVWDRANKEFRFVVFDDGGWDFGIPKFIQPNTEWTQYTGLKDKNGVEIYEGDIVLTDEAGWKARVIYDRDCFMCIGLDGKGFSSMCNWENFEVIGNIYKGVKDAGTQV